MELIRGLHNLRPRHRGCVATIGAFDGVHCGHQAVIRQLLERSAAQALPSTVVVFEPLPREYFAPLNAPARLTSFREKFVALEALGVDRILRISFTQQMQKMSAQDFVDTVFVEGLAVAHVVLGDDFRFGNAREGDLELMEEQGRRYGFDVEPTITCECAGERISSTRIREALDAANFELAETLLGRPFSITGKVVYGNQLGRTIGFPTANIRLQRLRAPLSGVYAVEVSGAGLESTCAVANVGTRPTVNDSIKANLEVHVLDRELDLYGERINVVFRHKLREEQKFESIDELQKNIARDVENARTWFER